MENLLPFYLLSEADFRSACPGPVVATSEKAGTEDQRKRKRRKKKSPSIFRNTIYEEIMRRCCVLSCTSSLLQSFFRNPTGIKKKADKKRKGRKTKFSLPSHKGKILLTTKQPKYRTRLRPARLYYCKKNAESNKKQEEKKKEKKKEDANGCIPLCLSSISRLRFASPC